MKKRMERERETVSLMIHRYCRDHHGHETDLCPDCADLLAYAEKRLRHCPFQEGKTTCGRCPVHCYRPDKREKIREVMRTVGPRMLLIHPLAGFLHMIDGLRRKPKPRQHGSASRRRSD